MHGPRHLPWHECTREITAVVRHQGWRIEVTAECRCYRDPGYSEVVPEERESVLIERDGDETTCSFADAAQWIAKEWVELEFIDE